MKYKAWWMADNLSNVGEETPAEVLRAVVDLVPRAPSVLEFGCGPGRVAALFPADGYLGVDLNPQAVELARRRNPRHAFREVDELEQLPRADLVLAHTVLLHVRDRDLPDVLDQLVAAARRTIVVVEIMDPAWSLGRWYQRAPQAYAALLELRGFSSRIAGTVPHPRYANDELGRSNLLTVLVADRATP